MLVCLVVVVMVIGGGCGWNCSNELDDVEGKGGGWLYGGRDDNQGDGCSCCWRRDGVAQQWDGVVGVAGRDVELVEWLRLASVIDAEAGAAADMPRQAYDPVEETCIPSGKGSI